MNILNVTVIVMTLLMYHVWVRVTTTAVLKVICQNER